MRSAFIIRRVLALIPTLLLIYSLTFFLMHSTPGGPWDTGEKPIPADVQERLQGRLRSGQTALAAVHGFPRQSRARRSRPVVHAALAVGHRHHRRDIPGLAAIGRGGNADRDAGRHSARDPRRGPPQPAARLSRDVRLGLRYLDAVVCRHVAARAAPGQQAAPGADQWLGRHLAVRRSSSRRSRWPSTRWRCWRATPDRACWRCSAPTTCARRDRKVSRSGRS